MPTPCGWTAEAGAAPATWTPDQTPAADWRLAPHALLLEDGSGFLEFEDCSLLMFEDA